MSDSVVGGVRSTHTATTAAETDDDGEATERDARVAPT